MALSKGINSYATVEEADAYFADRLDNTFSLATSIRKAQALVTATMLINNLNFIGVVSQENQTLSFPRIGYYMDVSGHNLGSSMDPTPIRVIKAVYELANHLLTNENLLDDTGKVVSLDISSIKLDHIIPPGKMPSIVLDFLRPLRLNGGGNTWWRAN
jgi:hypothetical protein